MSALPEQTRQSFRAAWQGLRRAPGYALALALLSGAVLALNVTVFASVWAMQFKSLPYPDAEQLVALRGDLRNFGFVMGLSTGVYQDLKQAELPVSGLGAYGEGSRKSLDDGSPIQLTAVSPDLFPTLGVTTGIGRVFNADDLPNQGVIISEHYWRAKLGARPDVLGQTLRIDDRVQPVIGVMPAGFRFPDAETDAWSLLDSSATADDAGNVGNVEIIARLAPDATHAAALQALNQSLDRIAALDSLRTAAKLTGAVWPLRDLYTTVDRTALALLLMAALLVYLLVTANIANLIAERMQQREREWQLRESLGAGHWRLLLTAGLETGVPLLLGALAALCALPNGLELLRLHGLLPASSPMAIGNDLASWGALAVLTTGMVISALIVIALTLRRGRLGTVRAAKLKTRSAGRHVSYGLLVVQIIVATALLGLGGLLVRSVDALLAENPGFAAEGVAVLGVDITGTVAKAQRPDPAQMPAFELRHEQLMIALRALPGVLDIGATQALPFSNTESASTVILADGRAVDARSAAISAGLLEALRVPLLAGRYFDPAQDREDGEGILVDGAFMGQFLPDLAHPKDAVGMLLQMPNGDATVARRIVGVVGPVKHRSLDAKASPAVYRYSPHPIPFTWIVVRSATQAETMLPLLRKETLRLEPDANIIQLTTLATLVSKSLESRRAFRDLVAGFAAASVVLAAFGLYAVLAFAVRQRAYEWSVRAALGARAMQLLARVLRDGLLLAAVGITLGIGMGVALAQLQADRLHGVGTTDLLSWGAVSVLMLMVVVLASLLPARRAALADPAQTLRES